MAASWRHGTDPPRPEAVGVLALEVYFPTQHVHLSDMEAADGCPGKYTQGLGQEAMSFCSDREDVVSMALTVVHSLMEKYGVRPEEVGYVQVASESGVDRSKSIKSHLMTLFSEPNADKKDHQHHHHDQHQHQNPQHPQQQLQQQQPGSHGSCSNHIIGSSSNGSSSSSWSRQRRHAGIGGPPAEGADCVHACYGGTAALLAAAAWVESRRWDGRLAMVVAADVALYARGTPARPTGGCGAAAILVGPDAPLVLDPLWYGSHSEHSWDFFKPLGTVPYPTVDGPQTLVQFLGAVGLCGCRLAERLELAGELAPAQGLLPRVDYYVSHAPFNKLVRKGFSRLALLDAIRRRRQAAAATGEVGGQEAGGVPSPPPRHLPQPEPTTAAATAAAPAAAPVAAGAAVATATAGAAVAAVAAREGAARRCDGKGRMQEGMVEDKGEERRSGAGGEAAAADCSRAGLGGIGQRSGEPGSGWRLQQQRQEQEQQQEAPGASEHQWVREWVQEQQQQQEEKGRQKSGAIGNRKPVPAHTAGTTFHLPGEAACREGSELGSSDGGSSSSATTASPLMAPSEGLYQNLATADRAPEGPATVESALEPAAATAAVGQPDTVLPSESATAERPECATAGRTAESGFRPLTDSGSDAARRSAIDGAADEALAATTATARALSFSSYDSSYATWRLDDKALEAQLLATTASVWSEKAEDGSWLQKQVGNTYTACVWQGLASLVWRQGAQLAGRRVLLFSFGSGTIASLLSFVPRGGRGGGGTTAIADGDGGAIERMALPRDIRHRVGRTGSGACCGAPGAAVSDGGDSGVDRLDDGAGEAADGGPGDPRFTLEAIQRALSLKERLRARVRRTLAIFDAVTAQVAASYACPVPYEPHGDLVDVAAGAYYLVRMDEHSRRWYERKM